MENEFKAGEYIVVDLNETRWHNDSWNNACFLQSIDSSWLKPKNDFDGNIDNTWSLIKKESKFWRYATEYEINYYKILNGPYNVTELTNNNVKNNYNRLLHILKFINNYGNNS